MIGKMCDWAKRRDQWLARSWPWAWDVKAGLHPIVGIVASCVLIIVVSIGLSFSLRATGPLFGYSPGAPLYLYSAVAQSLAAYMTLALTALFIASQLLGPNYSWGFARLLVTQLMLQVALGMNLGVVVASLFFLATPDWWGVVGNTPLIVAALAFAALIMLTYYVVNAVLSLEPSRFVEQCTRQAQQIIAAEHSEARDEYVLVVIKALRDIGLMPAGHTQWTEQTIKIAARGLTNIRSAAMEQGKWEKGETGHESEVCWHARRALADVAAAGVWSQQADDSRRRSQVSDLLIQVWMLAWEAYRARNDQAWKDALYVVYWVAEERQAVGKEYWLDWFRDDLIGELSMRVGSGKKRPTISSDEKPLLDTALLCALKAAWHAVEVGEGQEACPIFLQLWREVFLARQPDDEGVAQQVALSLVSAVMSLGAWSLQNEHAQDLIPEFLPIVGELLADIVTSWQIPPGTFIEEAMERFNVKHDEFTKALSERFFPIERPLETPGRVGPGGFDPTPHLGVALYTLLRCYLEAAEKVTLGYETMEYRKSAAWMSSTVDPSRQGILQTWSEPLEPLLGGDDLSSLLDGLEKKLIEFEMQRDRDEQATIHEAPLSPQLVAEFEQGVEQRFTEVHRVANLLNWVTSAGDGQPVTVRRTTRTLRELFVEIASLTDIGTLGRAMSRGFAACEDYCLLRTISEFTRSDLGYSDLSPRDISEMRLMLEEIYEGPACLVCLVGGALYEAVEQSPDFQPWYREAIAGSPRYSGRLGEVAVYVTDALKPEEAVSFIPEQIGDLSVSKPLEISDPEDLRWDEDTATKRPMVSIELSEELQVALSADGEPRVWDLSQWISTEEPEA